MTTAESTLTTPSRATGRPSSLHELARLCGLETSLRERTNWRRRARQSLEAVTAVQAVNDTLGWLARARTPSTPRQLRTAGVASSGRSS